MNKQKRIVADSDKQLYGDESDKLKRLKKGSKTATIIDNEEEPGQSVSEEMKDVEVRKPQNRKMIDAEVSR